MHINAGFRAKRHPRDTSRRFLSNGARHPSPGTASRRRIDDFVASHALPAVNSAIEAAWILSRSGPSARIRAPSCGSRTPLGRCLLVLRCQLAHLAPHVPPSARRRSAERANEQQQHHEQAQYEYCCNEHEEQTRERAGARQPVRAAQLPVDVHRRNEEQQRFREI
jgi:hypothetical protein